MEEFYLGKIGLNNNFPYRGNSLSWDLDTNIAALTCYSSVQMKDPFDMKQIQSLEMQEKKLLGLDEVGRVFTPHSIRNINVIKDPYVLSPELNHHKSTRIIEHLKFSPSFLNRKFLTVITSDGITRLYEKSKSNDSFEPHFDIHPLLMEQSYGLPTSDTEETPKSDPLLGSNLSDYKKWSHVSADVKTKIERKMSFTWSTKRETEETYGLPEFARKGKFRNQADRKKKLITIVKAKKKWRKKWKTKKKKKQKRGLEDYKVGELIGDEDYLSEENELTESEIHELTKYVYNSYVKKLSQSVLTLNKNKEPRARWLIFPPIFQNKSYEGFVSEMWEKCDLAKKIKRERKVQVSVVNKEIRRRIRYFLRQEAQPPEDYTELSMKDIFLRNWCVDKNIRKRRVLRSQIMEDESEEEEEEADEEEDIVEKKVIVDDEDEDDEEDEDEEEEEVPVKMKASKNVFGNLTGQDSRILDREFVGNSSKKGKMMSSILFASKMDCVNTTCSEWCESYEVAEQKKKKKSGRMADEDEEEEEEVEEEVVNRGGIVAFHVFGTRSGMVSLAACLIPTPPKLGQGGGRPTSQDDEDINDIRGLEQKNGETLEKVVFKFMKYVTVHQSRIVSLHWSTEGKTPFLVTSSSHGSIRIWNLTVNSGYPNTAIPFEELNPSMISLTMKSEVFQKDGIPSRILETQRISIPSPPQTQIMEEENRRRGRRVEVVQLVFPKGNTLIVVSLTLDGDRLNRGLYRSHKGHITGLVLRENHHGNLDAFTTSYDGVLVHWRFYFGDQQHQNNNRNQQQQQQSTGRIFERVVLLDDSRKESFYWGLVWSPNRTHLMVACEENPKNFKLKKLTRRNVWKLIPVGSQSVDEFVSTCMQIAIHRRKITTRPLLQQQQLPIDNDNNKTMINNKRHPSLNDVMRLVEKQISDGMFMEFADRFDQVCVGRSDYWFNKFVFSVLSNLKGRFDEIPEMKMLRKRLNCLLRYMHASNLMNRFINQKKGKSRKKKKKMSDEDDDDEEEEELENNGLINVSDWILSYHYEIASGSQNSELMRNDGFLTAYINHLRLILQHVYNNNKQQQHIRIQNFVKNVVQFYEILLQRQKVGSNSNELNQQQQQESRIIKFEEGELPYLSREKCPICNELNPSKCGNLFVDGNHCRCSKNHFYDRDVLSFQVIDLVLGIRKCKYCFSKTLEKTYKCPICVGSLFSTEIELFQKYF